MTKYILHGGGTDSGSESNAAFFREVVSSAKTSEVNIVCVYFARPEGRWGESYAQDQSSLFAAAIDVGADVTTELGNYDLEEFIEQVARANIIFIQGGRRGHLKDALLAIPQLAEKLQDKTVVGISAGANILSRYYYSSVADTVREGIGILPIALLCHANRDAPKETLLRDEIGNTPLYKINEEQSITLSF